MFGGYGAADEEASSDFWLIQPDTEFNDMNVDLN